MPIQELLCEISRNECDLEIHSGKTLCEEHQNGSYSFSFSCRYNASFTYLHKGIIHLLKQHLCRSTFIWIVKFLLCTCYHSSMTIAHVSSMSIPVDGYVGQCYQQRSTTCVWWVIEFECGRICKTRWGTMAPSFFKWIGICNLDHIFPNIWALEVYNMNGGRM